ncbi:hypothetical protein A0128_17125 [Leptospira tipperaryensis]|uniref:Uncharacterized protein n=1 Tax=Leptospira tipperaryensis TaxID=2564040 RepID=A0A1D7V0Q9_9LEPT|nr:hypothetical protein A0128_17125 [Leptospira tipperaryensis]
MASSIANPRLSDYNSGNKFVQNEFLIRLFFKYSNCGIINNRCKKGSSRLSFLRLTEFTKRGNLNSKKLSYSVMDLIK